MATEHRLAARAVVDASGTWTRPNPLGADGLPALGETDPHVATRLNYRVPDLDDPAVTARYAGRHIALAGSGHSALTALAALAALAELAGNHPGTQITWLLRRGTDAAVQAAFGGGTADQLPARGALGLRARAAVESGVIDVRRGFRTAAVDVMDTGTLRLTAEDGSVLEDLDEVIALTGFRPDLTWLSEVRLDLDPVLQAPRKLAPMIDPDVHSCGSVPPHGACELATPEPGLYVVGMKSYGRAPTFLALTGYEQVRSVAAELAGDHEAAARVELELPETACPPPPPCGTVPSNGNSRSADRTGRLRTPANETATETAQQASRVDDQAGQFDHPVPGPLPLHGGGAQMDRVPDVDPVVRSPWDGHRQVVPAGGETVKDPRQDVEAEVRPCDRASARSGECTIKVTIEVVGGPDVSDSHDTRRAAACSGSRRAMVSSAWRRSLSRYQAGSCSYCSAVTLLAASAASRCASVMAFKSSTDGRGSIPRPSKASARGSRAT